MSWSSWAKKECNSCNILRINIILDHIRKYYFIQSINPSQSIKTIYIYIYMYIYIYIYMYSNILHPIKMKWVDWTLLGYISWSLTTLQPHNHLTPIIYDTVLTFSWLEKHVIFDHPCLTCKHEKLLFQKLGDFVLHWGLSSFQVLLTLQP